MNDDRRSFLKNAAVMTAGAGLFAAGATTGYALERRKSSLPKLDLVMPKVSRERRLRSTVGLRPHRPIGFRLEAEKLEGKTIVHNYGHGGSGWSLSWGTGHLAADLATATGEAEYAVLGAGCVGLAAARLLQRRGKHVTIYTKVLPPRVTSNYASAGWSPTATLCDPAKISEEFKVVFEKAARLSHRYFQDFIGQDYGVHYRQSVRFRSTNAEAAAAAGPATPGRASQRPSQDPGFYGHVISDLAPKPIELAPEQHGMPFEVATLSTSLRFETHTYLHAMLRDFVKAGGRIVIREFTRLDDILALREKTSVNCLGIGAKQVCNDEHITPIRGQLTILSPQPDLKYGIGFEGFSASPRYDGVAVGNTMIMGEWSTVPDINESNRVVDGFHDLLDKIKLPA